MNNERRKQIEQARGLLSEALELIREAGEAERDAFDNMPEGLQAGERGQAGGPALFCYGVRRSTADVGFQSGGFARGSAPQ